ncbi:MAG: apolipoprotein N-acyltransferase, partial [Bacteroidetes bacterium]|nr:apolipoprotein N-acyltransferase [Bacteroidota bacterium]
MKRNYQLALLSAFLLWFAWPPIPYSTPILLLAFLPILMATENIIQSEAKNKGKLIFKTAFLCFFFWNTASIYWVFNSMNAVMPSWLAAIISLIPFGLGAVLM